MFKNTVFRLAVIAVFTGVIFVIGMTSVKSEVPRIISYQGCLTDTLGKPVPDGVYNLTFALYTDSVGGVPVWSNDIVKAGHPVSVVRSFFNYNLGSVVPLPSEVFSDSSLWLGITIVEGKAGELTPRSRLSSVPFAFRALYADNVPAGGGWSQGSGVVYLTNPSDKVGIGVSTPQEPLVVGADLGSYYGDFIQIGKTGATQYSGFQCGEDENNRGVMRWDNATDELRLGGNYNGVNYPETMVLKEGKVGIGVNNPSENLVIGKDLGGYNGNRIVIGDTTSGHYTGLVTGEDADNRAWLLWNVDENFFGFGLKDGGTQYNHVLTMKGNRVGIGTSDPSERLVIGKDLGSYAGDMIVVGNDVAGRYSGVKLGEDADNCGNMIWSNDDNYLYFTTKESGTVQEKLIFRGGKLSLGDEFPFAGFTSKRSGTAIHGEDIPGTMGGTGVLGKSSDESGIGVKGMAMGNNGGGILGQAYGAGGYGVHAEAKSDARIALYAEAEMNNGVAIVGRSSSEGMAGKFYGNVALYSPTDDHMIMMFGEGLDYAEGFHASDPTKPEPGAVMSIDPKHPGKLTMSITAYDTRVAGIVAGANNLGSGVRLGTDGFDLDVALAGRVYCNVEATQQAIRPGDLLTTSSIPGYAMKATDYTRAQGAILGKAMESLDKGEKGQILVLVTLQ